MVPKSSQHSAEFHIVCMILYGWIRSSAMFKQQDVRWYGFQWSILISIDYCWSANIHGAISTPWYSYCIWNSYIKITTSNLLDAGNDLSCSTVVKTILYGNNRDIDGRREYEDIRDSRKIIYIYIYIIHLTYLYSYWITTLYHNVVSKNLIVFSMFDCL